MEELKNIESLGEQTLNNRTRVGRSALRKACFKRRSVALMRETLNEKRPGIIENRMQSYLTEVISKGDPEICLYFLQEFRAELSPEELARLENIIAQSGNEEVIESYKKLLAPQVSGEGEQE